MLQSKNRVGALGHERSYSAAPDLTLHRPAVRQQTMEGELMKRQTEQTYSDAELQIVRVKLDIIRSRMGNTFELIPTDGSMTHRLARWTVKNR